MNPLDRVGEEDEEKRAKKAARGKRRRRVGKEGTPVAP
jgi:hypothetical protein